RAKLAPRLTVFVNQLTNFDPADPIQGLARWAEPVCPSVTGLSEDMGEFVQEHVVDAAQKANVRLGGDKCRTNLYVLVSPQPEPILRAMEKKNRTYTFGDASQPLIDAFIQDSRPIKVWYFTEERTPEGQPLIGYSMPEMGSNTEISTGNPAMGMGQDDSVHTFSNYNPGGTTHSNGANAWSQASHLRVNAVGAIYRVFVYIDRTKLHGANIGQIADYVAMVGLAQIKPGARLGDAPTILTLFSKGPQDALPGMSSWDRVFLKSLYETDQQTKMQRNDIALDMVRAIAPQ
ncbi:MAG TPA: hypothetical protein VEV18_04955, partial [Steroidobacteraceae bacterium]|nr:hypothetical protein [Steroidobacteraceae bacterium]